VSDKHAAEPGISRAEQISGAELKRSYQRPMLVVAILLILALAATIALTIYSNSRITGDFQGSTIILENPSTVLINEILLVAVVALALSTLFGFLISLMKKNQRMEQHLYHLSNYDSVTSLLNRNFFFTYLANWEKTHNVKDVSFGLLFIDLDNFKSVNDKAGHATGDSLLRLIAGFLKAHTDMNTNKDGICGLCARIGGDEFLQIIPDISSPEELDARAHILLHDFNKHQELRPFIDDYDLGLSIGGSLFPSQTEDYNELVKLADIAMYKSKYGGKNNYTLYQESMGEGTADMVLSVRMKPSR